MHPGRLLRLGAVVVAASLAYGAEARAASAIIGRVTSAETKQPAEDVVVTAASPSLDGERVAVTDARGEYRIPNLPPGVYVLRFEKDGSYAAFVRSEIQLRQDRTIRVIVELLPPDIEVEGCPVMPPPVVDFSSTSTGMTVREEFVRHFAVSRPSDPGGAARSFDSLAELAPGAQRDAYGVSLNGATSAENAYLVDGLSTNDPALGINASPLSTEFLEEDDLFFPWRTDVLTGGYLAEYGRATGGIVQARTRSGSNVLHGEVFGHWTPGFLEGTRALAVGSGVGPVSPDALVNLGDFGATLGGPLQKDKLWFFAGVLPSLGRARPSPNPSGIQALGKLTWLLNRRQRVALSLSTTPSRVDLARGRELDSQYTQGASHYSGQFLDQKLWLDAHLGYAHQAGRARRYQANAHATYWWYGGAGSHLLKAGVDAEFLAYEPGGGSTRRVLGGFVQDSWSFHWLTLNAGVRYDAQSLAADSGAPLPVPRHDRLSPRVGLAVAPLIPFGVYGLKLFAHYAKYRGLLPLGQEEAASGGPRLVPLATREFLGGAEYEVRENARLVATYTHRDMDAFTLSPAGRQRQERTYDAITVALMSRRMFRNGWFAEASYTWSRLSGSDPSAFLDGTGAGEPGGSSDFDLGVPGAGSRVLLPYDRTHFLKAFGGREFSLLPVSLGLAYRGGSGTPLLQVLPPGATRRTPWVHILDANLTLNPGDHRAPALSFSLDVFNLLNSQEVTRMRERAPGEPVPVAYQAPRQVRFEVRYSF